jgi:uncharacterized damage-inducible protein DinB
MKSIPWFERTFNFDSPAGLYPEILERLRGTPIRLILTIQELPTRILTKHEKGKWSIQEHAGHLGDLEPLWLGRVEDILAGEENMRAADLTNKATFEAEHNQREIDDLLKFFYQERKQLVDELSDLNPEDFEKSSRHPRLKSALRLVDLCLFVAEHDDYHLARIRQLAQGFLDKE